jgi:TolB-like protein/Tfp pilus assembly protein PilF
MLHGTVVEEQCGRTAATLTRRRRMDVQHLLSELKRRRVFRALVGYGIVAFAVLQVIEPVMHGLHWSDAVLSYVVVGLGVGFPIVVTLAWIFDAKSGGIERTEPIGPILSRRHVAAALAGIGLLAAAPGFVYYFLLGGHERATARNARSVAILPFASLSSGEENSYFAQGFHDELLREVGRIQDVRLISRASVLQYKNAARNLREIADALGVTSIVEGSVQRAGNRVRVEVMLVDAQRDQQIWGDRYDRDLTDVFSIQTAIAEEIADALHAHLSAEQKALIGRQPTQSTAAYDLYLRGLEYQRRPDYRPDDLASAQQLYEKAVEEDPSFALARARLAEVLVARVWFNATTDRTLVVRAKEHAETAVRLQPDLPEAHLALGYYFYRVPRDYPHALQEFQLARAGDPNEAIPAIGFVARRAGRFDEALRMLEQSIRLDPRSPNYLTELALTLLMTRSFDKADAVLLRALKLAPDSLSVPVFRAVVQEAWKGENDLAKEVLRDLPPRLDRSGRLAGADWSIDLLQRNPREALTALEGIHVEALLLDATYPTSFLFAVAHEALGDTARARKEYEAVRPRLEEEVRTHPDNPDQHCVLARAYAGLGRKEDALREARRAVEIQPVSVDAFNGPQYLTALAEIEARVGETSAAIERIRYLLSIPSFLAPGLLRSDPRWAPLKNDARFRELAGLPML